MVGGQRHVLAADRRAGSDVEDGEVVRVAVRGVQARAGAVDRQRSRGRVALAGWTTFWPAVGVPVLTSNTVTLSVASPDTYRRVPLGLMAKALGKVAPAGSGTFWPFSGMPVVMSNTLSTLLPLATYRRVPVLYEVGGSRRRTSTQAVPKL